ncbi:hypothetical protein GCM10025777_09960 [Membranihabitans marinus]
MYAVINQIQHRGNILDIGCGEGQYLIPLAKKFQSHQFHGMDLRSDHIDFLKTYINVQNMDNLFLKVADIETYNLDKSMTFDCIYLIGILQYLHQPEKLVARLANVQIQGQKMVVYSPIVNIGPSSWFKKWQQKFKHYDNSQQNYSEFDLEKLINFWGENGYNITEKQYYYGPIGRLGREIYNALLLGFIHSHITIKIFALLFLLLLSPIFVTLQVVDSYIPKKSGNSILFIAEKK